MIIKVFEDYFFICVDEKMKRLKDGTVRRYVYYGCDKKWITGCKEPWIREEDLLEQLYKVIDNVDIQELATADHIKQEIEKVQKMIVSLGGHAERIIDTIPKIDARSCARFILKEGNREEKRNLLENIQTKLRIEGGKLSYKPRSNKEKG